MTRKQKLKRRKRRRLVTSLMILVFFATLLAGFRPVDELIIHEPEVIQIKIEEFKMSHEVKNTRNEVIELANRHYNRKYTMNDVYLLAQLIYAEARGESFYGKLAVATVVLNRAEHGPAWMSQGKHTLEGVIFCPGQFDGVRTKAFYEQFDEESLKAAHMVLLEGYRSFRSSILYFYNPKTSTDHGFIKSVKPVIKIGNHVFAEDKEVE